MRAAAEFVRKEVGEGGEVGSTIRALHFQLQIGHARFTLSCRCSCSFSLETFLLKIKIKLSHCTKLDLRIFSSTSENKKLVCFSSGFSNSFLFSSSSCFSRREEFRGSRRCFSIHSFAPSRSLNVIWIVILIIVVLLVGLFVALQQLLYFVIPKLLIFFHLHFDETEEGKKSNVVKLS